MNKELRGYLLAEMVVSAAFNLFINGMIAALIYHQVNSVPTDAVSIVVDLTLTCVGISVLTALFSKASVRRTKTIGILESKSRLMHFLSRLFKHSVVFGLVVGLCSAAVLSLLVAPTFTLFGVNTIPFGVYVALKCVFCAAFGGGMTALELYAGMCKGTR